MLRHLLVLPLILTLQMTVSGQDPTLADTATAQALHDQGYDLYDQDEYDSAIYYFRQSFRMYDALGIKDKALKSQTLIGENHWRKGNYDSARFLIRDARDQAISTFGDNHDLVGDAWRLLGIISGDLGDYEEGFAFAKKSQHIKRSIFGEYHRDVAVLYNSMGLNLQNLDLMDSSLQMFEKALIIWDSLKAELPGMADTYNYLGALYYRIESPELALKYHWKALDMRIKLFGENSMDAAISYQNIGAVYRYQYRNDLALDYMIKSLEIKRKKLGEIHWQIASSLFGIGNISMSLRKYNEALEYFQKSYRVLKESAGDKNPNMIFVYSAIGRVSTYLENFEEAEKNLDKALALAHELFSETHYMALEALMQYSNLYLATNEYDKARYYIRQRIALGEKQRGVDHQTLAPIYFAMGRLYEKLAVVDSAVYWYERSIRVRLKEIENNKIGISGVYDGLANVYVANQEFDKAFINYQKAINSGSYQFESDDIRKYPAIPDVMSPAGMTGILSNKAYALENVGTLTGDTSYYHQSLNALLYSDSLINHTRKTIFRYNDQIVMGNYAIEIYKIAVRVCSRLYELTQDDHYQQMAFYFLESSKSNALNLGLSRLSAKNLTYIPEELTSLERNLKSEISDLTNFINQEEAKKEDNPEIATKLDELFTANNRLDSVTNLLERSYPKYHDLKYNQSQLSLSEIQDQLDPDQAIIAYFVEDSSLFAFVITKEEYALFDSPKPATLDSQIVELNRALNLKSKQNTRAENLKDISRLAAGLGSELLQRPLEFIQKRATVDQLIIIPDGKLSYLPFEILIPEGSNAEYQSFKEPNYLIKAYTIRYGYSARSMFAQPVREKGFQEGFVGYAPSYSDLTGNPSAIASLGRFRDEVISLAWNQEEVQGISAQTQGVFRLDEEATEAKFKAELNDYSVVHLAMHALVDDQEPMNSKLVFQTSSDSIDDGYLHAYELFNMEINPELVVLSACNTGYGKLEKGEGVMSLAYGFAYAGCPSIVMSQWLVNDYTTKEIMLSFYKYLEDGFSKDEALRQAKLDFLSNADPEMAHPGYWAPFVLIGDNEPLSLRRSFPLPILMMVLVFLIIFGGVLRSRKRNAIPGTD